MIIRALFTKKNYLRYISHLDLVRLFHRTFNRCQIPIKHSEGFNPHPKFSIANPLSLGIESEGEFIEIDLDVEIPINEFITKMNNSLPEDIQIIKAVYMEKESSISNILKWAFYEMKFVMNNELTLEDFETKIEKWLVKEEILISRFRKKGKNKVLKEENIRPSIANIITKGIDSEGFMEIQALLKTGEEGNLRPLDFIEALNRDLDLNIDMDLVYLNRLALYAEDSGNIYSPL